jgi:hypothetical protein
MEYGITKTTNASSQAHYFNELERARGLEQVMKGENNATYKCLYLISIFQ